MALHVLVLTFATAVLAGCVSEMARGGLLMKLATLAALVLPRPAQAGAGAAPAERCRVMGVIAAGVVGASGAAAQAVHLPALTGAVPIILALVALRVLLAAWLFDEGGRERIGAALLAAAAVPLVGFHAATLGPWTGTPLVLLYAALRGCRLLRTGSSTSALEAAAAWGATAAFIAGGVLTLPALVAARAGKALGAKLGTRVAARRGAVAGRAL